MGRDRLLQPLSAHNRAPIRGNRPILLKSSFRDSRRMPGGDRAAIESDFGREFVRAAVTGRTASGLPSPCTRPSPAFQRCRVRTSIAWREMMLEQFKGTAAGWRQGGAVWLGGGALIGLLAMPFAGPKLLVEVLAMVVGAFVGLAVDRRLILRVRLVGATGALVIIATALVLVLLRQFGYPAGDA